MNNRKILGITIIMTALLVLTVTSVVAANGLYHSRGPNNWQEDDGFEDGYMWGPMHDSAWYSDQERGFKSLHSFIFESIADISDLTVEEIEERINDGEHLFTIAIDAGVSQENYFQTMFDARESYFEDTTDEDRFREDNFQWMFGHMDEFQKSPFYGGCHGDFQSEFGPNYRLDGPRE